MKKTLLVLGLIVFFAASAQAGFNFGVKSLSLKQAGMVPLEFTDYYVPFMPINQILGCYFGIDVGAKVVILGSLDFNRTHAKWEYTGATDVDLTATQFTPQVGVKFYLQPRTSGDITPYFYGGFFKTFTSLDLDAQDEGDEFEEEFTKEVNSPFGFIPAFGVEYYFSDNFSVGGEVGLRFTFAKGSFDWASGSKTELSYSTITKYIGFLMNYRFGEF